ncbi:hypothetical protein [Paenibacillus sp. NPDC058071]|uniref:hypothetical protein n=1 Tax=Paenibacillus sp. NPDC058071 TaxID=3346326 RepID=UPI0036D96253
MSTESGKLDRWDSLAIGVTIFLTTTAYFVIYRFVLPRLAVLYEWKLTWPAGLLVVAPLAVFSVLAFIWFRKMAAILGKPMKRDWILLAIIAVQLVVLAGPYYTLTKLHQNGENATYSYNGWVSQLENRQKMLPDLLKNHDLESKERLEIVDLLGAPSDPYDYQQGEQFLYSLGSGGKLVIDFQDDRVSGYEIVKR